MAGRNKTVKLPIEAFKHRPERLVLGMSDREQDKVLKKSGLVKMMDQCYPYVSSQHN